VAPRTVTSGTWSTASPTCTHHLEYQLQLIALPINDLVPSAMRGNDPHAFRVYDIPMVTPGDNAPMDAIPVPKGISSLGDIQRRTSHEVVREKLRFAILAGSLAPGTSLVLSDLSEQLGTSRTPIREAIRDLATEGLVDFDAFKSPVVHVPTLQEAREIYQLRMTLEALAVRDAVSRTTDDDLQSAQNLCDLMENSDNTASWAELNRQFHAVLISSVTSKRLRDLTSSLQDASAVQVVRSIQASPMRVDQANREHRQLLQAFRDRDTEAAVRQTTQHLLTTLETIETYEAAAEHS
jgi:DNA-binding GntR family transcriptional regulator